MSPETNRQFDDFVTGMAEMAMGDSGGQLKLPGGNAPASAPALPDTFAGLGLMALGNGGVGARAYSSLRSALSTYRALSRRAHMRVRASTPTRGGATVHEHAPSRIYGARVEPAGIAHGGCARHPHTLGACMCVRAHLPK